MWSRRRWTWRTTSTPMALMATPPTRSACGEKHMSGPYRGGSSRRRGNGGRRGIRWRGAGRRRGGPGYARFFQAGEHGRGQGRDRLGERLRRHPPTARRGRRRGPAFGGRTWCAVTARRPPGQRYGHPGRGGRSRRVFPLRARGFFFLGDLGLGPQPLQQGLRQHRRLYSCWRPWRIRRTGHAARQRRTTAFLCHSAYPPGGRKKLCAPLIGQHIVRPHSTGIACCYRATTSSTYLNPAYRSAGHADRSRRPRQRYRPTRKDRQQRATRHLTASSAVTDAT